MTEKEKAKAYDEVREKIALRFGSNVAEKIFSEFEMSKDERIRKRLLTNFSALGREWWGELKVKDILFWLEKRGSEPNWCHHKVDLSNCSEEYRKAYYDGWNNCNQQHSQCAWSEEDERIINKILCICNDFERSFEISPLSIKVIKEDVDKIDNWLLSIKKRIGG